MHNISQSTYHLPPLKTPLVESSQSSIFVRLVSELSDMMLNLINRKIKLNLSLSEFSKLH